MSPSPSVPAAAMSQPVTPGNCGVGRVLIIAGSDSGGGAGIQADIKTVTCLGGYATTAITALTAQNTVGVFGVQPVPVDFIRQQMEVVLADIGADALKTGMLYSAAVVETVADVIRSKAAGLPLVVDPVMIAKSGTPLLEPDAVASLRRSLIPLATVVTPNLPEAEVLCGFPLLTHADRLRGGQAILALGCQAVLLKGGHSVADEAAQAEVSGQQMTDLLITRDAVHVLETTRIATRHTHGTGCALASALAAGLAQGLSLLDATRRAQAFVHAAIAHAPGYGAGHGPMGYRVLAA